MSVGDPKPQPALGFLTVIDDEQLGLTGGYLVLNLAGRPLEFHCTAPVRPNRAQQILFGPTLEQYFFGEQIGRALVSKGSVEPLVVCTDVPPALCVREYVDCPVALVLGDSAAPNENGQSSSDQSIQHRADGPLRSPSKSAPFHWGRNCLAVADARPDDRQAILGRLADVAAIDLLEPFARIREAVQEAHKTGRS